MAVPGLRYVADYLAPDVHDALLAATDAEPWQPHVDHAAFDDTIVSISLGSGCVIELARPLAPPTESVFLEPRSALVLSGDARHHWTHGIAARGSDLWDGVERPRGRRLSLTFRTMLPDRVVS